MGHLQGVYNATGDTGYPLRARWPQRVDKMRKMMGNLLDCSTVLLIEHCGGKFKRTAPLFKACASTDATVPKTLGISHTASGSLSSLDE